MPNVAEPNKGGPRADEPVDEARAVADLMSERLVEAACQGDAQAAQALVAQLTPSVLRLAHALCHSPDDAAEVAQESFLQVFGHLSTFRQQARLSTWVHRIVVNTALMRARQRARRPWDAVQAYGRFWEHEADASSDVEAASLLAGRSMGAMAWALRPDEGAIDQEMRHKIQTAIRQLPERYRAVFVLREVEGHDTDTVAEMLGLTQPTVKARLLRARGFLRHALTPYLQTRDLDKGGRRK